MAGIDIDASRKIVKVNIDKPITKTISVAIGNYDSRFSDTLVKINIDVLTDVVDIFNRCADVLRKHQCNIVLDTTNRVDLSKKDQRIYANNMSRIVIRGDGRCELHVYQYGCYEGEYGEGGVFQLVQSEAAK